MARKQRPVFAVISHHCYQLCLFTALSPPALSLVLYSHIVHYQKTISLSLKGFSERGIWLVGMIADTSLKPGIMEQELSLSVIPAALALTIL